MSVVGLSDPAVSFGPGFGALATTGLVLVALATAAWLARRGSLTFGTLRRKPPGFSVETAFSLGERRSLAVVTVEGRRLLLGLTPANISLITELPGDERRFAATLGRHETENHRP